MNKINLSRMVLLALFIALPVSAQHRIGIVGGLNLANVNVDPSLGAGVDLKNLTAFGVGGVLDLRLAQNFDLHLEPMYLQKGTKLDAGGQEGTFRASYLELPALFRLALGTGTARPYLMAGPTIGYLLSAKSSSEGNEEDVKDQIKDLDFGLDFGAGVSFPAGNNSVFVEGRYALGLSNINDDPQDPTDIKNKGIQIMAGITFPLGGK